MFRKKVVDEIKTHVLFSVTFVFNPAVYEIMWKNIIERDPIQMTILHMRIAWWIIKATKTLVINNNYCFSTSTVVTSTHCVIRTLPVFVFMFC